LSAKARERNHVTGHMYLMSGSSYKTMVGLAYISCNAKKFMCMRNSRMFLVFPMPLTVPQLHIEEPSLVRSSPLVNELNILVM
jgi:hypothetical protein